MSESYLGETAAQGKNMHVAGTGVNGKVCAWLQQAQDPDSCTQGIFIWKTFKLREYMTQIKCFCIGLWFLALYCLYSCLELNRCQTDLNDLKRLVQKMQTLELGKAVSNGELKRIISMQVKRTVYILNAILNYLRLRIIYRVDAWLVLYVQMTESLTWKAQEEIWQDMGTLSYTWNGKSDILGANINFSLPLMLI